MVVSCTRGAQLLWETVSDAEASAQWYERVFGINRASLDRRASWLDELGIEHSGVIDTDKPVPCSAFERNGWGAVSAGAWESCDWLFSGGGASVAISWDGLSGPDHSRGPAVRPAATACPAAHRDG